MEEFKIELNSYASYTDSQAPSLSTEGTEVNMPFVPFSSTNIAFSGNASLVGSGDLKSKNYRAGESGYIFRQDGTSEIN